MPDLIPPDEARAIIEANRCIKQRVITEGEFWCQQHAGFSFNGECEHPAARLVALAEQYEAAVERVRDLAINGQDIVGNLCANDVLAALEGPHT